MNQYSERTEDCQSLVIGTQHAEHLTRDYLKVSPSFIRQIREDGQPSEIALTFAALASLAGPKQGYKTFASVAKIAEVAQISVSTCRRHLAVLERAGVIKYHGRERRRTVTYAIASRKWLEIDQQNYLPISRTSYSLTWAERLVLAVIVRRHCFADVCTRGDGEHTARITLGYFERVTSLGRSSVRRALRSLEAAGIIVAKNFEPGKASWVYLAEGGPEGPYHVQNDIRTLSNLTLAPVQDDIRTLSNLTLADNLSVLTQESNSSELTEDSRFGHTESRASIASQDRKDTDQDTEDQQQTPEQQELAELTARLRKGRIPMADMKRFSELHAELKKGS